MARLYLVRHGRARAAYHVDRDPGLDDEGHKQAERAADALENLGPLPILVSPMRRCRETARPLEERWGVAAQVEPAVSEVVAPTDDLVGRGEWLRAAMGGVWSDLEPEPQAWRAALLDAVRSISADTVVFTHFMVINAVIGAVRHDDAVLQARLDNGSITVIESRGSTMELVAWGATAETEVL